MLQEAAFKTAPEPDLTAWLVKRAHRRYGLAMPHAKVGQAWAWLAEAGYANDGQVHDGSGVGITPGIPRFEPTLGWFEP